MTSQKPSTRPPRTAAPGADPGEDGHRRRWAILAVLVFALQAVVLDTSVLNVALKTIAAPRPVGLGAGQTGLAWAVNSYTLTIAALLFTGGLLSDRFGRKRVLLIGLVLFGVSSLLCAYADSPGHLIAARAALGAGAAAVMPSALAIIADVFPRREQGKAIGIWAGSVGLAIASGPVVGGALLDHFWWGSVFLVNVPLVLAVLTATVLVVPESRNPVPRRLDPLGVALLTAGLVAFLYGVIRGGDSGDWPDPHVWVLISVGVLLLAGFVVWEARCDHPALDVRLFRDRGFSAAVISVAMNYFALLGGMFFFTFYLQTVRGLTPLRAGLWSLPFAASQLIVSPLSSALVRRFGARTVGGAGLFGIAAAFLGYQAATTSSPTWVYGLVAFAQGACTAVVMPSATTTMMTTLPRELAGIGSSVNNTVRQIGGATGIAVLGTVLTTVYRARAQPLVRVIPGLPASSVHAVSSSIQATDAAITEAARTLHGGPPGLIDAANEAFVHAMHATTLTVAAVMAVAGLIVLAWTPGERYRESAPTHRRSQEDDHGRAHGGAEDQAV